MTIEEWFEPYYAHRLMPDGRIFLVSRSTYGKGKLHLAPEVGALWFLDEW